MKPDAGFLKMQSAAAGPAAAAVEEEKDEFDVMLSSFGANKINVIKVIREYTGWGLAEAKTIVEGFPPIRVGHGVPRDRAEALAKDLTDQGASMLPLAPVKP